MNHNPEDSDPAYRPDIHPNFTAHSDFDWQALLAACDGEDGKDAGRETAVTVIHALVTYEVGGRWQWRQGRSVGLRSVALAWLLYPQLFSHASEVEMARKLKTARQRFSRAVADAAKRFGLRHPGQRFRGDRVAKVSASDKGI